MISSENLLTDGFRQPTVSDSHAADSQRKPIAISSVSLHIQVTEAPVLFAQQIKIEGNRSFPSRFIKEWFQLESGYLAVTVAVDSSNN